ncbi:MAG: hypothetical protein HYU02_03605 [Thaumarchaeota archaeon]|nr:hypothetical protein [Nitrososphaerota archaeon]
MPDTFCPECGAKMFFDISAKTFICTGCGIFATREQVSELRYRLKDQDNEKRKKRREHGEYLEWWLSKK